MNFVLFVNTYSLTFKNVYYIAILSNFFSVSHFDNRNLNFIAFWVLIFLLKTYIYHSTILIFLYLFLLNYGFITNIRHDHLKWYIVSWILSVRLFSYDQEWWSRIKKSKSLSFHKLSRHLSTQNLARIVDNDFRKTLSIINRDII